METKLPLFSIFSFYVFCHSYSDRRVIFVMPSQDTNNVATNDAARFSFVMAHLLVNKFWNLLKYDCKTS